MAEVEPEMHFCRVFKSDCYSVERKQVSLLVSIGMVTFFSGSLSYYNCSLSFSYDIIIFLFVE